MLKISTLVASKPCKDSKPVSEMTMFKQSVIPLVKPVWVKAGKAVQLIEPTEVKEPKDKVLKMVKPFMLKAPVMADKESA